MTETKKKNDNGLTQSIDSGNAHIKAILVKWTKTRRALFGNEIAIKNIELSGVCSNDGLPVSAVIKNNAGTCVAVTVTLNQEDIRTILAAGDKAELNRAEISKKTSRPTSAIPT